MVRSVLLVSLLLVTLSAAAHPGVSVVADSRGNIYYTDLHHVWRVDAAGRKTIAVPNVHTHELAIDAQDNLYGEHLWYEGERTDKWGHRVWRRSPDGRVADIIPAREGFLRDYSFQRDRAGNMYWVDRERGQVRKRAIDGRITTLAHAPFRDVRWMTVMPDGIVYFIDTTDLIRVTPSGSMSIVVRGLASGVRRWIAGRHAVMGLWTDRAGNVYAAVSSDRAVKRITPRGEVTPILESTFPWSPTGGTFAPNGDLWILEYSTDNRARVRRISRSVVGR